MSNSLTPPGSIRPEIDDSAPPAQPSNHEERLMAFVMRAVDEVGATLNTALVVLGDKLGYYRAMTAGPVTPEELAERTHTRMPYTREWLAAQAAGGILEYAPDTGRYTLPAEHAVALTDETSPAFLVGLFQIALGTVAGAEETTAAIGRGEGRAWADHSSDVHLGCERFFAPSYRAHLTSSWLPSAGLEDELRAGATVVDIGCGHGASTILMAQAYPASRFIGVDSHADSLAVAADRARVEGTADRITFVESAADRTPCSVADVVTTFDALHDLGDPAGTARHVKQLLRPGGKWLIVEPMASDRVEENFTPVGRAYYGFSTLLCTPGSLSQPVGAGLGTQAGPARVTEILLDAGFASCRTVAATPFHRVMLAEA